MFGTRELLMVAIQKLSSQLLVFALAVAVVLAVITIMGAASVLAVLAILGLCLTAMLAYLLFEARDAGRDVTSDTSARVSAARLQRIRNRDSSLAVEVWTTRADAPPTRDIAVRPAGALSYRVGDSIVVNFHATADCFVTLLNVGTSGKLTVLFPNRYSTDNRVTGGALNSVPRAEDGFAYELRGPPGVEHVKAIASSDERQLLDLANGEAGSAFRTVEATTGLRDIAVVARRVEQLPKSAWAEADHRFEVLP